MKNVKIKTYPDPYKLTSLSYWPEIADAPHFCVSQTLVNGLRHFYNRTLGARSQFSTVYRLQNFLYHDWLSKERRTNQMVEVDKAVRSLSNLSAEARSTFAYNARSMAKAAALLAELGVDPFSIKTDHLSQAQKYFVKVYKRLKGNAAFAFERPKSQKEVNDAIIAALRSHKEETWMDVSKRPERMSEPSFEGLSFRRIVIDGVHQFTPGILTLIDDLSKYFEVVLMFNYQEQYKDVYQTWVDIYSQFDLPIAFERKNSYRPTDEEYQSRYGSSIVLADRYGRFFNGDFSPSSDKPCDIEVTEFDNVTEFANYVARIYENAKKDANISNPEGKRPVLRFMKKQFYAPSLSANTILRSYFPEQFGERHFLDYPFGHFFVSLMELWNPDDFKIKIDDFSYVFECFDSGAINEPSKGYLSSVLGKVRPLLEEKHTIDDIKATLRALNLPVANGISLTEGKFIGYCNVTTEELSQLSKAFDELDEIANFLFKDYRSNPDGFRSFYANVQSFIQKKSEDQSELDDEMADVIKELLDRLNATTFTSGTPSFQTLRNTMSYFLGQNEKAAGGAQWIVRGFEQIDGDILRSAGQPDDVVYHFAMLTDADMLDSSSSRLPWPIDLSFLQKAVDPEDTNYRIYVRSKEELKNFNRYALLYGLEFSRSPVALSYVKEEGTTANDFYSVFNILGLKPKPYSDWYTSNYREPLKFDSGFSTSHIASGLGRTDSIKAGLCPYRFAVESVIENHSVYRDTYLVESFVATYYYMGICKKYGGQSLSYCRKKIESDLDSSLLSLNAKFVLPGDLVKLRIKQQILSKVESYGKSKKVPAIPVGGENIFYEFIKEPENFNLKNPDDIFAKGTYPKQRGSHCKYCSCQDICLENKKEYK